MTDIEEFQTLKIETESGDFIFVLNNNRMYYEFYDEKEDEEYEILIWNGDKLKDFESVKDADKYLALFLEYKEKNK